MLSKIGKNISNALWIALGGKKVIYSFRGVKSFTLLGGFIRQRSNIFMPDILKKFSYAVYLDSRDVDTLCNVNKWFENDFFNKKSTIIILRSYPECCSKFVKMLDGYGFSFVGYNRFRDLSCEGLKAVFYPFNTNTNHLLLRNRNVKHVFIGHGDSDKIASINPLVRIYDHIFVAGSLSIDRYFNNDLFFSSDDRENRFFRIGTPYIAPEHADIVDSDGVLYAPTWEGANDAQAYSSILLAAELIAALIERGLTVYFQPHPSTGVIKNTYRNAVEEVIMTFEGVAGFKFVSTSSRFSAREGAHAINRVKSRAFSIVITDISSMAIWAVAQDKRLVSYIPKDKAMNLEQYYLTSRSDYIFSSVDELRSLPFDFSEDCTEQRRKLVSAESYLSGQPFSAYIDLILARISESTSEDI
ncbi:hypothetical protein [uncultured Microbulbifer sp.]|uniref:hypothetical protein n=1 Tax=uncultured Microbulbifer sp. TaxID=348147 RepID=UPI0026100A2E|nr:hypothetical protein [uncultured Microbulbifer sp.]